jgi:hypothetical protein
MDRAEHGHVMGRVGGGPHDEDAPADHDLAVVGGDGAIRVVAVRIVELLDQVFLAEVLILMVDGLGGRDEFCPRADLAAIDRPPVEFLV